MMWGFLKRLRSEEKGQVLVGVALSMAVLLGMGAFVLDYGVMAVQKSQLQNAADAAALAGAQSIHLMTQAELTPMVTGYALRNVEDSFMTGPAEAAIIHYDRSANTLGVRVSQTAGKLLSGFLGAEDTVITAEATARLRREWDGEALPFLNYQVRPVVSVDSVVLWSQDQDSPQIVDRVEKKEYELVKDPATLRMYYKLSYEDGIGLQNGVASDIKAGVQSMISNGSTQYLLSISKAAFDSGKYQTISNLTIVPISDLVLLKVNVASYYDHGGERQLTFTIQEIYDISNGVYPETALHSERFDVKLVR